MIGSVNELNLLPCLLSVNRGSSSQFVVGPSRFKYNHLLGHEFRVAIPDLMLGSHTSVVQTLLQAQQQCFLEIFVVDQSQSSTFEYGSGPDIPQNYSQFQELRLAVVDLLPQCQAVPVLKQRLSDALNNKDLSVKSGGSGSGQDSKQMKLTF